MTQPQIQQIDIVSQMNFGALKRATGYRVNWKFMVSNLRVEDGTMVPMVMMMSF